MFLLAILLMNNEFIFYYCYSTSKYIYLLIIIKGIRTKCAFSIFITQKNDIKCLQHCIFVLEAVFVVISLSICKSIYGNKRSQNQYTIM